MILRPPVYLGFRRPCILRNTIRRWLTDLFDCLKQRFPHVKLLESFTILFSPSGFPINYADDNYDSFGESELKFILESLYGFNSRLNDRQSAKQFMITVPFLFLTHSKNGAI